MRDVRFPNQRKFTSTPQGRNWLWHIFAGDPLPGAKTFMAYSADAERAGFLPEGWVDERALEYGGWDAPLARQELMAQELEMAGQVYQQFARERHVRTNDIEIKLLRHKLGGVDFGAVSPTALIAAGQDAQGRGRVFAEWYKRQATMDDIVEIMADWGQRYGITRFICDPAGKHEIEAINRIFGREVAVRARHGNRIELRTQYVGRRLNVQADKLPGLFIDPSCANLIMELEGLMWKRVKLSGRTEEILNDNFEPGCPDHAHDGLACLLSEWDAGLAEWKPPKEPVTLYKR